jgi:ABC-type transporter Mla subunit MlaD
VRRLAVIALGLAALVGWASTSAGADDTTTYRIDLDNAFGIVVGSQVRVAGVTVGSVTDLAITPEKRAEVTIEVSNDRARLGTKTRCSSEPQSLIA